jgi:hypothetical protein
VLAVAVAVAVQAPMLVEGVEEERVLLRLHWLHLFLVQLKRSP